MGGDGGKDEVCAASATSGGAAGSRPADRLARSSGLAASWRAFQRHATAEPASTLHIRSGRDGSRGVVAKWTRLRLFRNGISRNRVRATGQEMRQETRKETEPTTSATTCNVQRATFNVQRATFNVQRSTLYVVPNELSGEDPYVETAVDFCSPLASSLEVRPASAHMRVSGKVNRKAPKYHWWR